VVIGFSFEGPRQLPSERPDGASAAMRPFLQREGRIDDWSLPSGR
jgi:hypothetical protein